MRFESAAVLITCENLPSGQRQLYEISSYLVKNLHNLGYRVGKLVFLEEEIATVASEILAVSTKFDVVLTVGNLRREILFKALSKITSQDVVSRKLSNDERSYNLPGITRLNTGDRISWPLIRIQQIFVINEELVEDIFENLLKNRLKQYREEMRYTKSYVVQMNGHKGKFEEELRKFDVDVNLELSEGNTVVNLSSGSFTKLVECERKLRGDFGECIRGDSVGNLLENLAYNSCERHVQQAIEDIEKCYTSYGPDNVFISFNGGKDCTVLLHLVLIVLRKKYPDYKKPLFCLYVRGESAFAEQDEFIAQCELFYGLDVRTVRSGIKEALGQILTKNPNFKACFMGTRRTDPYCKELDVFQMTDPDWPQIMRVSPLLDWHYSDIWDYLLYYKVPYCTLYDSGYTSIGNVINTIRNPSLLYTDPDGNESYLPAYKMLNETKERAGRNVSKY